MRVLITSLDEMGASVSWGGPHGHALGAGGTDTEWEDGQPGGYTSKATAEQHVDGLLGMARIWEPFLHETLAYFIRPETTYSCAQSTVLNHLPCRAL